MSDYQLIWLALSARWKISDFQLAELACPSVSGILGSEKIAHTEIKSTNMTYIEEKKYA